jgi:hypothetical protein
MLKLAAGAALPVLLIMLSTGCNHPSGQEAAVKAEAVTPLPADTAPYAYEVKADLPKLEPEAVVQKEANHANDKVSLASAPASSAEFEPLPEVKPAPVVKPNIDVKQPYTQSKPTLLGLTLKMKAAAVETQIGKPKLQFTMEDETDPLVVYDYESFMVGFNKNNELEFIDIRSDEIDPGLGGLKLGSKVSEAISLIGQPDTNSSYVLTYKSEGALLKLDVNPSSSTISSIKLFKTK